MQITRGRAGTACWGRTQLPREAPAECGARAAAPPRPPRPPRGADWPYPRSLLSWAAASSQFPIFHDIMNSLQSSGLPFGVPRSRRWFLRDCGVGLGKIALAGLLSDSLSVRGASLAAVNPLGPRRPHFPARAKAVIHLFMAGAPSQLDLFDYKPALSRLEGKPMPPSVIMGQRYAFIRPDAAVLGPRFKFSRYGKAGTELSEMLPAWQPSWTTSP